MNFGLLLAICIGYVIGTLPTAWIVMRRARGVDIRTVGSGNVGARNTYEVSGSRTLGIIVMLIDAGKGVLAVAVAQLMFEQWYLASGMAAAACVAGHNYNPWLGFKGGRGLATAAGAWLWLSPLAVVLWGLMYLTGYYAIRRDMHVGAMSGTLGLAVLILGTPDRVLRETSLAMVGDPFDVKVAILAGCFFIFLRHIEPIRAVIAAAAQEPDDDQE
jgi:acyl phosphate:glycerol-3-phosphate acyltransferase